MWIEGLEQTDFGPMTSIIGGRIVALYEIEAFFRSLCIVIDLRVCELWWPNFQTHGNQCCVSASCCDARFRRHVIFFCADNVSCPVTTINGWRLLHEERIDISRWSSSWNTKH